VPPFRPFRLRPPPQAHLRHQQAHEEDGGLVEGVEGVHLRLGLALAAGDAPGGKGRGGGGRSGAAHRAGCNAARRRASAPLALRAGSTGAHSNLALPIFS
jgi:hypothetical protein